MPRRRLKPAPTPRTKEDVLSDILKNESAKKRVEEIRKISLMAVEEAHLRLATELAGLKGLYGCSYRELSEKLGEVVSGSTLQNICNRTRYIRPSTYHNLASAINAHRRFLEMTDVEFPPLPDSYR